jgi:hypothetical protein
MKVLKKGRFESSIDLMKLNIIDWNRLNGFWDDPGKALESIASWFIGCATYTVIEYDLRNVPDRDDFPGWDHVGHHENMGRLFWNDFFYHFPDGKLQFADAPDFYGSFPPDELGRRAPFWGDIGKISASGFTLTQKQMPAHSLWISVVSVNRQVLIEPLYDIQGLFCDRFTHSGESFLQLLDRQVRESGPCPYCYPERSTSKHLLKQLPLF